jgi:phage repressor protein C with HTH and peptisase S24 domain
LTCAGVKRIDDDKDGLKCVSDNPKYLPFTVPKDQLRSVCLVVGLVRF